VRSRHSRESGNPANDMMTSAFPVFLWTRPPPEANERVSVATLLAGFGFIWHRKPVLGAISLDLFAVLLGGATALLPIYAKDVLDSGPWGLGLLRAASSIGALAMALVLARNPLQHHVGRRMFVSVAVFGLATIVFGLSHNFMLSLVALAVSGAIGAHDPTGKRPINKVEAFSFAVSRLCAHHDALADPAERNLRSVRGEIGRDPVIRIVLRGAVVVSPIDVDKAVRTNTSRIELRRHREGRRDREVDALEQPAWIAFQPLAFGRISRIEATIRSAGRLDAAETAYGVRAARLERVAGARPARPGIASIDVYRLDRVGRQKVVIEDRVIELVDRVERQ
jgi:hypothetical protein